MLDRRTFQDNSRNLFRDLFLRHQLDHVDLSQVEVETVVLETRADVVVAAASDTDLFKFPDIFEELFSQSDENDLPSCRVCLLPSLPQRRPRWSPASESPSGRGSGTRRCNQASVGHIPSHPLVEMIDIKFPF